MGDACCSKFYLHNRLTFDLGKKSKIFYYSQKEDPKISRIAEFAGEML